MNAGTPLTNAHVNRAIDGTRYLTFQLAEERYGVEILKVQDMTCHSTVVRVGAMPAILRGFVTLAGTLLPVIDLRQLSSGEATGGEFNVIIAVQSGGRVIGLVVDAIGDVLTIASVERPTDDLVWNVDPRYISGIGKADDKIVRLLDVDRLLDAVDALAGVSA